MRVSERGRKRDENCQNFRSSSFRDELCLHTKERKEKKERGREREIKLLLCTIGGN